MSFAPTSPLTTPGPNKFLSIFYHQWINYAIYTFADLRLADILKDAQPNRGLTVEEILGEERKQWDAQLLHRILHACVYGDIVRLVNDDKHFALTESGLILKSDDPSRARDYILLCLGPVQVGSCQQLPNMVREPGKGSGTRRSTGLEFYELIQQPEQKEFLTAFNATMTISSVLTSAILVKGVDFSRFKTLVDIGGNRGTLMANILKHCPTIEHGIVFDLPKVVNNCQNGEEFIANGIPKNRWDFVAGNMFDPSTIPQADAYITKHVIHSINDEQFFKTLSAIYKANENKSTPTYVLIVDHIILPNETLGNWHTFAMDILMAALAGEARERTVEEHKQMFEKAGFKFVKLYQIEAPQSVIEAVLCKDQN